MTVKTQETKLCYLSRPGWRRPAFIPTVFFLSASWSFCALLMVSVISALANDSSKPVIFWIVLVVTVVLVGYLTVFTKKYLDDLARRYEFELGDREVVLRIDDRVSGRRLFVHMPYSQVSFVEYYTPLDNAELVFHGLDHRIIEIPTWSMTEDISAILEFLKTKNIRVVQL